MKFLSKKSGFLCSRAGAALRVNPVSSLFHPTPRRLEMLKRKALCLAGILAAATGLAAPVLAQEIYIPLVSKGFQHQFWQAVKSGAEQAGKDLKV
jgi:hypothetical protein